MGFADDLKAQLEAERDTADVPFTLNGNPYVLRFTQLDSWEWGEVTDRHPARVDAQLDRSFGYNMRAVVKAIAPRCGELFRGAEPVEVEDWQALFTALSPSAVQRMCSAVFSLHESETIDAVVKEAKKALHGVVKNSRRR